MDTNEISVVEINPQSIKNLIYELRGQMVMLDSDLATIYGYSTRAFNQQVKNNHEKFAEDFMFQLTKEEADNLRSKNMTSSSGYGGRRYRPYAFTEQGIYMLMTVLKGELLEESNVIFFHIANSDKPVKYFNLNLFN